MATAREQFADFTIEKWESEIARHMETEVKPVVDSVVELVVERFLSLKKETDGVSFSVDLRKCAFNPDWQDIVEKEVRDVFAKKGLECRCTFERSNIYGAGAEVVFARVSVMIPRQKVELGVC